MDNVCVCASAHMCESAFVHSYEIGLCCKRVCYLNDYSVFILLLEMNEIWLTVFTWDKKMTSNTSDSDVSSCKVYRSLRVWQLRIAIYGIA